MEETWRSKLSPPAVPMWVLLVSTYVKLPDATADGLGVGTVAEEVDWPQDETRKRIATAVLEIRVRMTLLLMLYPPYVPQPKVTPGTSALIMLPRR
jgi:hypothetical protein